MPEAKFKLDDLLMTAGQLKAIEQAKAKFRVGDLLMTAAQLKAIELAKEFTCAVRPIVLHVVQIDVRTCHGGTQIFYECRGSTPCGNDAEYTFFAEPELVPVPDRIEGRFADIMDGLRVAKAATDRCRPKPDAAAKPE